MASRRIFWAALASFCAAAPAQADTATFETAYLRAVERIQKHSSDYWLDDNPQSARALSSAWTSLAEWTAAYLNEHPDATPKRLKRAAPGGDLDALPLGPRTMLISATVGSAFGTLFIVDGSDGAFRPAWSIRDRAGRETFPLLDAWTAKAAAESCRKTLGDAGELRCGSLGGLPKRLPDDAQGHPRFYVEASYAQVAGNAIEDQLSFWTWKNGKAEPQFVTTFGVNIDDAPPRLEGGLLKIRAAEDYRMMSPWWDHLDRAFDWTFRAGPEGIEDLGKTPTVPEVDIVDEVLVRAAHRLPADDLAARDVQTAVAEIVVAAASREDDGDPALRMAGDAVVRRQTGQTLICLPTEEAGDVTFTLTGSFISGVSVVPDEEGKGCPQDKP
jgi:hypothetical protein